MRRAVATLVACVLLAGAAARAWAEDGIISKRMRFIERGSAIEVTTSFTEIFDQRAYEKLTNGMAHTVVVRTYVYAEGADLPVAYRVVSFRVAYGLWTETFTVERNLSRREVVEVESRAEALKLITSLDALAIAPLADIPRGRIFYLGLVVELNPMSAESLAEMRRWLTRANSASSLDRGSSFFGSVVSIFVNPKLPEADRVVRLRSQPFYRPRKESP